MRTSCISHPENTRLIIVREWQSDLFADAAKCALLSLFEYWHSRKLEQRQSNQRKNRIAEQHGDKPTQDESLLQHHTAEELEAQLMGIAKKTKLRKLVKELAEDGFISIHKNPNPRYKFDSTNYYLFSPEAVKEALNYWDLPEESKTNPRHIKFDGSGTKSDRCDTESDNCAIENDRTRSEITLEITQEGKKEESPTSLPDPFEEIARLERSNTPKQNATTLTVNNQKKESTQPAPSSKGKSSAAPREYVVGNVTYTQKPDEINFYDLWDRNPGMTKDRIKYIAPDHEFPELVAHRSGELWVGPGVSDFMPEAIAIAKKRKRECKQSDDDFSAVNYIVNLIENRRWRKLESLLGEAKAKRASASSQPTTTDTSQPEATQRVMEKRRTVVASPMPEGLFDNIKRGAA